MVMHDVIDAKEINVNDLRINGELILQGSEEIAAGGGSTELDMTKAVHIISADAGGDVFTISDGVVGQQMTIIGLAMAGTATITPDTMFAGTSVTFNAAGDSVVLMFIETDGWTVIGGNSYAII